jgi:hypothetical protein
MGTFCVVTLSGRGSERVVRCGEQEWRVPIWRGVQAFLGAGAIQTKTFSPPCTAR